MHYQCLILPLLNMTHSQMCSNAITFTTDCDTHMGFGFKLILGRSIRLLYVMCY